MNVHFWIVWDLFHLVLPVLTRETKAEMDWNCTLSTILLKWPNANYNIYWEQMNNSFNTPAYQFIQIIKIEMSP